MTQVEEKRLLQRINPIVLAVVAYTILTLVITYPLITQMSSGIAGIGGDSLQHLWSLWWGKKALLELHNSLADVSMLYHPQEIEHDVLGVTPWIQIVAAPLVYLFGAVFTYNLGLLLSTILGALTTFFLVHEITDDYLAAFLGGLIFAFAPNRFIHAFGHYAQIMTYLFPLYTLFLFRLLKQPTLRNSIVAGLLLTLSLLVNFVHVAYFVIPVTLILVGHFALTRWDKFRSPNHFFRLALTAAIALLLTAPFFLPFLFDAASAGLSFLSASGVSELGADLLAFLTPSRFHPLVENQPAWRNTFAKILGANPIEGTVYLGIIPLLLAVWGVYHNRRKAQPWLLLGIITLIFSLGPLLKINGEFVTYEVDGKLSYLILPYALLTKLPIFEHARTPGRINATTMLALAVLVGLGASSLRVWLRGTRVSSLLLIILAPLILFEYLVIWPFPVFDAAIPDFYYRIKEEEGDFAILDYPVYKPDAPFVTSPDFPMYYQTVHEHPIVGGYIWRLPPGTDGTMRLANNLVAPDPVADFLPMVPLEKRVAALRQLNIRYVVVHKYDMHTRQEPLPSSLMENSRSHLKDLLGPPEYEDDYIVAYRVPDQTPVPVETQLLITPGKNWTRQELTDDGIWRWAASHESDFYVYGQTGELQRLAFTAKSVDAPRHVDILVNDRVIGELTVDEERDFISPPFVLPLDQNRITLRSREPCEAPSEQSDFCLSLYASDVQLVAEAEITGGVHSVSCTFADQIELIGYDLADSTPEPGKTLVFTLYWQAIAPVEESYTVFTHLLNDDSQIAGQQDTIPLDGKYPTDWWTPGEIVVDQYEISLPPDAEPGTDYTLSTGLYLWPSGNRLGVDPGCRLPETGGAIYLTDIDTGKNGP